MPSRRLKSFRDKRTAGTTPEPFGRVRIPKTGRLFVIQQHQARHLHFDLRLEVGGVLRSWAVPKGPSADNHEKRFAAQVEDHPLDYANFEGRIPDGNYGAGYVIVWDTGTWTPLNDFEEGFRKGKLLFELNGYKVHGRWTLVRIKDRSAERTQKPEFSKSWLLIKERDQWAAPDCEYSNQSVFSGLTVSEMTDPQRKARSLTAAAGKTASAKKWHGGTSVAPMLASPGEAFDRKGWLFELKYDGYRILIERNEDSLVLRSRNGHDLTASFPEIAQPAARLPLSSFTIDGELVALNARGVPDFSLLQQRAKLSGELEVARASIETACTYYAFDALKLGDWDLRDTALIRRKRLLNRLLPEHGPIRYSEHVIQRGLATYATAVELGMEGVVAKRADSPYRSGRSNAWIKVRQRKTAEFVVMGATPAKSDNSDIGSLTLGEYRSSGLSYVGRVGSGLTAATRRALLRQLETLKEATPPEGVQTKARWVIPQLVCEVAYKEYTRDGHLRHPVFVRMRDDKQPQECTGHFDIPDAVTLRPAPEPEVEITNPDKIFFPEQSLTKRDLVSYYGRIAPWMLRYLKDRPIVLTRFPDGIHGKSFYQRDAPDFVPDWIQREVLWSESAEREVRYFIVQNSSALKYLANLGTIVIHTLHGRINNLEHPDWCVLDLDPKSAPYKDVVKLALAIGELAEELELPAYPKTSGASGLHVLIPLAGQLTHDHAKTLSELMARVIVARYPEISTIARSVRSRNNRVYIDYLQNGQGRVLVAPFSVRAEETAGVSMPLKWSELNGRLRNEKYHLSNAPQRMRRLTEDPMKGVLDDAPDLANALARLAEIVGSGAL